MKYLIVQAYHIRAAVLALLVVSSLSFQTSTPDRLSVKNLGISKKDDIEIFFNLNKGDLVIFTFKSSGGQVISDKTMTYSMDRIPVTLDNSLIREKQVTEIPKSLKMPADGQYLLTIRTNQKGVQFIDLHVDKLNGPWNSNASLVKVHSTILDKPGKNQKKLSISYPLSDKSSINIAGSGKSADFITLEENSFRIKTTLDKGITIQEKSQPEILIYLDEESLKKKNLLQAVEALFSKGKNPNLKNLAEINIGIAQKSASKTGESDLVFNNPSASARTERPDESQVVPEKGNINMPTNISPQDTAHIYDTPDKVTINSNFQRIDSSMYLSPVFDYSTNQKRKCKSISEMIGVGEDDMLGFWVGISGRQVMEYNRRCDVYKGKMIGYWSPLMQYANFLYVKKMMSMALNTETTHLPLDIFKTILDDIEVVIVDEHNKELFEKEGDYKAYIDSPYNGLYKTSGQMFGYIRIPEDRTQLYLCSCNKNKYNGVRLYTIYETFSKSELQ